MIMRTLALFLILFHCTFAQWNSWSDASTVRKNLLKAAKEGKTYFSQFHVYDARSERNHFSSGYKEATGEDLFVYGLDFYYATGTYFDSTYKADNRKRIIEIVRKMWKDNGAIPSFSWHLENPYVPSDFDNYMGCRYRKSSQVPDYPAKHRYVIREFLEGTGDTCGYGRFRSKDDFANVYETPAKWFDARIKEVASILNELVDDDGKPIPMIIRLWHEMEDDWMWWGRSSVSPKDYKAFFVLTEKSIKQYAQRAQILWGYGPDRHWKESDFFKWYPGDEYVDIIGFDDYSIGRDETDFQNVIKRAQFVSREAEKKGKVAALFETDNKDSSTTNIFFRYRLKRLLQTNGVRLSLVQLWSTSKISNEAQRVDRLEFLSNNAIIIKRKGE